MRVIICGAGQVGYNIASYLSREDNDITVIDQNQAAINKVNDTLDVNAILGHAAQPDTLAAAGANDADMVIAVTHTDEVNMVACQVAHSLFNVPRKIARIRQTSYLDTAWSNLFSRAHMPIDVIISPELEVARAITRRLAFPGTTNVIKMAGGQVYLCGVLIDSDCPLTNTPFEQLATLFPNARLRVVAILRSGQVIIPKKDDQMLVGDEVYFVIDVDQVDQALDVFGREDDQARRVVIVGGGNIGMSLIKEIREQQPLVSLKVIEKDHERAKYLSEQLEDVIIINGSGLDRDILQEVHIERAEALVAITDDDETNILGSLLAQNHGCKRTITLVNKSTYNMLLSSLGIGAVVSPRAITVSTIMQHVRRGRIKAVHNIGDGAIEAIEAEASENCSIINTPISGLELPADTIIGAIIHNGTITFPCPDTVIKPGDRVIFIASREQARKVEKLFSVNVNIF